jgi:hypothetical protein
MGKDPVLSSSFHQRIAISAEVMVDHPLRRMENLLLLLLSFINLKEQ